nr:unnamed protein product [Callosobruchus chinensis]
MYIVCDLTVSATLLKRLQSTATNQLIQERFIISAFKNKHQVDSVCTDNTKANTAEDEILESVRQKQDDVENQLEDESDDEETVKERQENSLLMPKFQKQLQPSNSLFQ